ncbi:MAG: SAM-dependent methyltransferase [Polyangiaceae bacterium]
MSLYRSLLLPLAFCVAACGSSSGEAAHGTAEASSSATPAAASRPAREAYPVPAETQAIVDAADRSDADKALDAGRHPAEMLAFFGVAPGMSVADIAAGGGYSSELFARAVGPKGKVWGQNSPMILEKFAEKPWSERLAKPVMKNVQRVDREFDDPIPAAAGSLDGVYMVLFYHDLYWVGTDRAKMNKSIFAALKPGGFYGIIDHSAAAGAGDTGVKTLHRIEESTVRKEIEAAGFVLVREGQFLRNPSDTLDWNDSPSAAGDKRGTSDRFALLFKKPG